MLVTLVLLTLNDIMCTWSQKLHFPQTPSKMSEWLHLPGSRDQPFSPLPSSRSLSLFLLCGDVHPNRHGLLKKDPLGKINTTLLPTAHLRWWHKTETNLQQSPSVHKEEAILSFPGWIQTQVNLKSRIHIQLPRNNTFEVLPISTRIRGCMASERIWWRQKPSDLG